MSGHRTHPLVLRTLEQRARDDPDAGEGAEREHEPAQAGLVEAGPRRGARDEAEHDERHPSQPREQLLSEVWGYAAVVGTRTVDVHVAQVRGKLGDASPIRTVRGVGYSAEAPDAP